MDVTKVRASDEKIKNQKLKLCIRKNTKRYFINEEKSFKGTTLSEFRTLIITPPENTSSSNNIVYERTRKMKCLSTVAEEEYTVRIIEQGKSMFSEGITTLGNEHYLKQFMRNWMYVWQNGSAKSTNQDLLLKHSKSENSCGGITFIERWEAMKDIDQWNIPKVHEIKFCGGFTTKPYKKAGLWTFLGYMLGFCIMLVFFLILLASVIDWVLVGEEWSLTTVCLDLFWKVLRILHINKFEYFERLI